jgi:hypothetical protein
MNKIALNGRQRGFVHPALLVAIIDAIVRKKSTLIYIVFTRRSQ